MIKDHAPVCTRTGSIDAIVVLLRDRERERERRIFSTSIAYEFVRVIRQIRIKVLERCLEECDLINLEILSIDSYLYWEFFLIGY